MKHAGRVPAVVGVLWVLVGGCVAGGCAGERGGGEDGVRREVSRGFGSEECPHLFTGRLARILGGVVPAGFYDAAEHVSDGRMVRIWNRGRTRCCIVEAGKEPRMMSTPAGAYLNRENDVILTCSDLGEAVATFPDGSRIDFTAFIVDADGRYLCAGGRYWDEATNTRGEEPITIRATGAPGKVLATSRMRGRLEKAVCFPDKLYIFVREYPKSGGAAWTNYEVYDRRETALVLADSGRITTPLARSNFVLVTDVCPRQRHFLLLAKRDAPLNSRRYLLDVKTKDRDDLGATSARFLDRSVFSGLLDQKNPSPPKASDGAGASGKQAE